MHTIKHFIGKTWITALAACFFIVNATAQRLTLEFRPVFGNETMIPGKTYCFGSEKTCVTIAVMKWYISNVRCFKNGAPVFEDGKSYLIDLNNKASLVRKTGIPDDIAFDEIRFYLGVDDAVNNNGVGDGDLDPTKGMYWTWQSGYINMKLEGDYKSGAKPARPFEFHLGGFLKPYSAFQEISIRTNNASNLVITADVQKFFEVLVPNEILSVMSPGEKAVQLSKKMALIFH